MSRAEIDAKRAAMRDAIRKGVTVAVAPTLFPTPPDVARRLVEAAELRPGCLVLEPSAGTGALCDAVREACPDAMLWAFEVSPELARVSGAQCADFLEQDPETGPEAHGYDRVVMNPPFDRGLDIRHVEHARRFLAPGGILVAIVADGPRHARAFEGWEWLERLPAGTFAGTGVRAAIIRWRGGAA